METLYRKVILNIVDRCFHMYASDYRKEAKESAIEMLEEIPDPTAQLKADKEELFEALENLTQYGSTGEDAVEMKREIESLLQKHKQ